MGYSVRVAEWRYTEWYRWDGELLQAKWDEPVFARELYDWRNVDGEFIDYDLKEIENVVEAEEHGDLVNELSAMIKAQFAPNGGLKSSESSGDDNGRTMFRSVTA